MDPPAANETPQEKETGRVEAFSDGVFAIAITLLVLTITVPPVEMASSSGAMATALLHQWPSYLAFVTSFVTVLIMWINHHNLFKLVYRTNTPLMLANGFLLLMVTAVPFPTALVSDYLLSPAAITVCAVYGGTYVLIAVAFNLLWRAVSTTGCIIPSAAAEAQSQRISHNYRFGFPLYLTATLLAFVSPYLTIAICLALWVVWVLTPYERRPARR